MDDSKLFDSIDVATFEWPLPNTVEYERLSFIDKTGLARIWQKINERFLRPVSGGEDGQVLTKVPGGYAWKDTQTPLPDIIPIEKGGTGVSSIEELRTMLFDFPTSEELFSSLGLE